MRRPLSVLVFTRESDVPYRARLIDSDAAKYRFCESEAEVAEAIAVADVVLGSVAFPAPLLARAERLKWIQVTGAGVDAFLSQGEIPDSVVLTRADLSFGDRIAEYVIGHLLALTQRVPETYRLQAGRRWEPLTVELVAGRTMGVAGTGSIGRAVAQRARGMGMRTVGLSRSGRAHGEFDACLGVESLRDFLGDLDVLVLCLPLTPETRGMLGGNQFAAMKPSAILVNTSRGAIVDEEALVDALRQRRIRAAILDVFSEEPLPASSPLWTMDNVTVTSHQSGLNVPGEVADFFLDNLARFLAGQPLRGLVDPRRGY